jgi:hypothetical protein
VALGQCRGADGVAAVGQSEPLGPPVGRVGLAGEEAARLHLVDHLDRRLLGDPEALGQGGQRQRRVGQRADHEAERCAHVIDAGLPDRGVEAVGDLAGGSDDEDREIGLQGSSL